VIDFILRLLTARALRACVMAVPFLVVASVGFTLEVLLGIYLSIVTGWLNLSAQLAFFHGSDFPLMEAIMRAARAIERGEVELG